ncbi:hypothetical protein OGAPHI_001860 [Ogataea philodendri]|uniref:Uncharacterized protein n=1 Tax=Ogataea philodendri TaxID=1378263 RepID=A0A9P8T7L7_9ASCO|nr:uncharacterized protein OGAPHI_001860 [Ogataea philodendri]KAH3668106.1 hypothetical protein OGAPHI_001860 [Ogataea philodendri]
MPALRIDESNASLGSPAAGGDGILEVLPELLEGEEGPQGSIEAVVEEEQQESGKPSVEEEVEQQGQATTGSLAVDGEEAAVGVGEKTLVALLLEVFAELLAPVWPATVEVEEQRLCEEVAAQGPVLILLEAAAAYFSMVGVGEPGSWMGVEVEQRCREQEAQFNAGTLWTADEVVAAAATGCGDGDAEGGVGAEGRDGAATGAGGGGGALASGVSALEGPEELSLPYGVSGEELRFAGGGGGGAFFVVAEELLVALALLATLADLYWYLRGIGGSSPTKGPPVWAM